MMMYYLFIAILKMNQVKYEYTNFFFIVLVTYMQGLPGCRFIFEAVVASTISPCYMVPLKYGELVGLILLLVLTLVTKTPRI